MIFIKDRSKKLLCKLVFIGLGLTIQACDQSTSRSATFEVQQSLASVPAKKPEIRIEIPAGRIGGLVLDLYQRPQADFGVLGPNEGKDDKYLLVGLV